QRAREEFGQEEMVPGFLEGFATFYADVEDENGATGFTSEHNGAWFCDVAWAARAIDGEGAVDAFIEAAGHHRKAAKAATRRASLRSAKTEPFDHFAGPLAVEGGGVHHHDAAISSPPCDRNNAAVPERPDALFFCGVGAFGVVPAEDFVAQR